MAEDIAPELLEKIQTDFLALLGEDVPRTMNYEGAGDYAERVGTALAEAFRRNLGAEVLPDGRMYWNIADRVVRPMLEQDYQLSSAAAVQVQAALNRSAGLGIRAQKAKLNEDRVEGFLNRLASAFNYNDVAWLLNEPVKTFSRSVVDDTLRVNVEFQAKAGLRPKIIRRAERKCCKWCSDLAGIYDCDDAPDDIYRRHENCRCVVEFDPGSGKRQNVWTRKWTDPDERDKIETRKAVGKTVQRSFQSEALLQHHYEKHVGEFGEISIPEYLRRANAAADRDLSSDVVQLLRSDGSTSKYCFSTNEFVVINSDGTIRTYFKPKDKEAYWQDELDRNN